MPRITKPHDHFFHETFSRPEIAADFLAHYLPGETAAHLDLDRLELEPASFIDDALRHQQADLLYRAGTQDGADAWIYVVFEHKSYIDRLVSLQILRYILRIWDRDLREAREAGRPAIPLRPIVPIILYHGRRRWNPPPRLSQLIGGPTSLRDHCPALEPALIDLSQYSQSDIVGGVLLRVALLIMQSIRDRDLAQRLPGILWLLVTFAQQKSALECVNTVLQYVALASEFVTVSQLEQINQTILAALGGEAMPTAAEILLDQGRQEGLQAGLQAGRQEGRQEGLRAGHQEGLIDAIGTLLVDRFGSDGKALIPRLSTISGLDRLHAILRTAARAESIAEVEQALR